MNNEPLKFYRVKIEVYPAIAQRFPYSEGYDYAHGEVNDEPIITKSIDIKADNVILDHNNDSLYGALSDVIFQEMLERGKFSIYSQFPDNNLVEGK